MAAPHGADQLAMNAGTHKNLILPDGRRLAYRHRPGCGQPLVLVHGLMDCSAGWSTFIGATRRPVVAFDLPGMGLSERPARAQLCAYAEDLADGIAWLGLHDFTLVGHSLGGGVATALAERIPHKVAALVLLAPSCFGRIAASEVCNAPVVKHVLRHALPLTLANPVTATGIYMAIANGTKPDRALLGRLRSSALRITPGVQTAVKATADAGRSKDAFFRRQVGYHGPVHALWGSKDLVVSPSHAEGVQTAFPHAQITVWEGMGHHPQHERLSALSAFIERAAADASVPVGRPHLQLVPSEAPQPEDAYAELAAAA
jgi:pimeloyl-ACP methyl ester carboxylesterase